jgi:RNA polymerase sigma-70 factor (ECF subfamily)
VQKHYTIAQEKVENEIAADSIIADEEARTDLYAMIEHLPLQKRKICTLKIFDGLSNQEIADMMKISVNTVKSHYNSTIKMLRKRLLANPHYANEVVLILFAFISVYLW